MPERTGAEFSADGTYRYRLWRRWTAAPRLGFIGLNPSTACSEHDDATIRKCAGFARRLGFGGIEVGNLFAFRSRWPHALAATPFPVGPDNDAALAGLHRRAGVIVACWGNHGNLLGRDREVLSLLARKGIRLKCLAVTAKGQPGHPLMLPYSAALSDFPAPLG